MPSSILSVGQSALAAAQIGLTTTGHNIANANTPGYSRQVVIQGTASAQDGGFGFVGKGTEVIGVKRIYNEYLSAQVLTAQTSQNELGTYYSQIQQVNNLFADSTSGLSPSLQEFFTNIQNVAAAPSSSSGAARQTLLSSAETLASQFQSIDGQLREMRDGVNSQINASIGNINSYASQIAQLNDAIEKAQAGSDGKPANDLLDQRDQVVSELSKEIKVTVVKQNDSYSVFIGNGQPLTIGSKAYNLVPTTSTTDLSRAEVGYVTNGKVVTLAESGLAGGKLGGLFDFRSKTLDVAQNSLGRMAIGLASTINAQHQLGQDQNGNLGGTFFNVGSPLVSPSSANASSSTGKVSASISNVSALTTSDYQLQWDGTKYNVTRLSDGKLTSAPSLPLTVDGVDFKITGTPATGDIYLVSPTAAGAARFSVAITDKAQVAAAAPVRTLNGTMVSGAIVNNNTGTGTISAGTVAATTVIPTAVTLSYNSGTGNLTGFPSQLPVTVKNGATTTTYAAGAPVPYTTGDTVTFGGVQVSGIPLTTGTYDIGPPTAALTYNGTTNKLSGFPSYADVTVTNNGTAVVFPAGTPVTYTPGATISYAGISFTISGTPADNDKFSVTPNFNGVGDNRNMLQLANLQTTNTLDNGSSTYQGVYGQLVNMVGNKTHELQVTSSAQGKLLEQAVQAQQSDSGVNLDEEATNLMRYQQAYQAAGKVMQTASKLFDVLLTLGQ